MCVRTSGVGVAEDLEVWSDFINGEGWQRFAAHASREWGPSGLRFQQCVRDAAAKKDGAAEELQLVLRLQTELIGLLAWPKECFDKLQQARKVELRLTVSSRRGPGL